MQLNYRYGCGLSTQSYSAGHGPLPEVLTGKAHSGGWCNQCALQFCAQPCAAVHGFAAQPPEQRAAITTNSRTLPLMRIAQSFLEDFLAYNVLNTFRAAQQYSVLDTGAQF